MIPSKNTEHYGLFCTFMKYESRLVRYFYRIGFHESCVKTIEKSLKNLFLWIFMKYEFRLMKNHS